MVNGDEKRLNELNKACKLIQPRANWLWGSSDSSAQGLFNEKRLELCITKECEWKLVDCRSCGSTGLLDGDQTDSEICLDCQKLNRVSKKRESTKGRGME